MLIAEDERYLDRIVRFNEILEAQAVLVTVLNPLIANIIEHPMEDKYKTVKTSNPKIQRALQLVGVPEFLSEVCKFTGEGEVLTFTGSPEDITRASRLLDALKEKLYTTASTPSSQREDWRKEILQRCKSQQNALREEDEIKRKLAEETSRMEDEDLAVGKQYEAQVRKLLHKTHRVRNHMSDAIDFVCRRMRSGKRLVQCPPEGPCSADCLEVHWHTRSSNMLYAYVFHVTPDGTSVIHNGPVLGFLYDTDPKSSTFGCSVMFSKQELDLTGQSGARARLRFTHESTVVTKCPYCSRDFASDLWV
eukprot:PhF_6_TR19095/c0_g1_i1/m.28091